MEIIGLHLQVRGIVQGVGFRPFVYSLAQQNGVTGWVRNTSAGVQIEINGSAEAVENFRRELHTHPPVLARIDEMIAERVQPNGFTNFTILTSEAQENEFVPISPDVSICPDCQKELFDPHDRRFRYPFINCTHCGPRFTIIRDIPYDRPNTTMVDFPLCPDCEKEYHDPLDRRFHAQPVACSVCGPQVWFETSKGKIRSRGDNSIREARKWIGQGKILAVKGLGGFHLVCDASQSKSVSKLRQLKGRSDKAFALMAFDLDTVKRHCQVSDEESDLLCSRQRPIVLLKRISSSNAACPEIAPGQITLGVMLAYTPLHLLLLEPERGFPELLVMTSGNLSEEPIAYTDEDARHRLAPMVDGFLFHNRPIHTRVDDSVARAAASGSYLVRRSRGYTPDSISLEQEVPQIFGAGGELKNTFCLTRGKYAFLSHHIGDLENLETLQSYETGISHFERLFRIHPEIIACDLHPNYLATHFAQERSRKENLPLFQVQHHHAHMAACLAENQWSENEPVIGLCFDGTGYGTDGAIWGGEFLTGNYTNFERPFHIAYAPLPGGDQAVRKPSRMALAHLWQAGLDWEPDLPPVEALCAEERTVLRSMLTHHLNSPMTSSMGRLFDAAASLIGIRQVVNYEGQAAIELEAMAAPDEHGRYTYEINNQTIDPALIWSAMIADWRNGISAPTISARFHNTLVAMSSEICQKIRKETGFHTVALSGGVWQNCYLLEHTLYALEAAGFRVLIHHQLPPNDGCLALGQCMVAATKMKTGNQQQF